MSNFKRGDVAVFIEKPVGHPWNLGDRIVFKYALDGGLYRVEFENRLYFFDEHALAKSVKVLAFYRSLVYKALKGKE